MKAFTLQSDRASCPHAKTVQAIPAGKNFKTLCPWHTERSPSCVIKPMAGRFHCFGCGQNGWAREVLAETTRVC